MPKLIMTRDGVAVREYTLDGERTTIGRHPDNAVFVNDQTVSSEHAEISLHGKATITDLGSTNGTYVNGTQVKNHVLHNGDIIQVGQHELRFVDEQAQEFADTTVVLGSAPADAAARLKMISGAKKGAVIYIVGPRTAVGRNKSGEEIAVVLHEGSRFQLLPGDNSVSIRVNDKAVKEEGIPLNYDDVITIGSNSIRFEMVK